MAGCSAGISTFNSCNKAGSIPHFTKHLSRHPDDYRALTWRGRAYGIIGRKADARADFQRAYLVSSAPQKYLAQAHINRIDGNVKQKVAILQSTTRQYPKCSEAWNDLGSHYYHVDREVGRALEHLGKANQLAADNFETGEPWFPWCNQTMGDIYYSKQQVPNARKHYTAAVESSETLTVGHLGLSKCDILSNNFARAESSFLKAKSLNPVLVTWETFKDFRRKVEADHDLIDSMTSLAALKLAFESSEVIDDPAQTTGEPTTFDGDSSLNFLLYSSRFQPSSGTRPKGTRALNSTSGSGVQNGGGSGGGNGGSGDGSGSDDDEDLTPEQRGEAWKKIKKEAPCRKKYRDMLFYQSKCQKYWYSKIHSSKSHGTGVKSYLKKYADKGRTIELIVSIDENMKEMTGKHESGKYECIKKSDFNGF